MQEYEAKCLKLAPEVEGRSIIIKNNAVGFINISLILVKFEVISLTNFQFKLGSLQTMF